MTNKFKTPSITTTTKILCFDVESNGLHGDAFAIGAVLVDLDGKVLDSFRGRCKIVGKTDEWVQQNVLPVIEGMEVSHSSPKHLRDNFWAWFTKVQDLCDYVVVQNGYPVEYRFLQQCQQDDLNERYWQHPFPILDTVSLMIAQGLTDKSVRKQISTQLDSIVGAPHNPVYDATITALTTCYVFKKIISNY